MEIYLSSGMFIEISDSIFGISRKAKTIHDPKHTVMVSGVKGWGKVNNQGIDVFAQGFGIFKCHNYVLELVVGIFVFAKSS